MRGDTTSLDFSSYGVCTMAVAYKDPRYTHMYMHLHVCVFVYLHIIFPWTLSHPKHVNLLSRGFAISDAEAFLRCRLSKYVLADGFDAESIEI